MNRLKINAVIANSLTSSKKILFAFILLFCAINTYSQEDNYIIKRGDVLNIAVMGHPEFCMEKMLVLPDGFVQFPGLGSIQASGMSIKEFTALISDNVAKFVLNPIVTVYVSFLPSQVVNVIGFVNNPGQIIIFEPINIIEAISKAGGLRIMKKCKKLIVIRADQSYEELNVKDLFSKDKEKRAKNIKLLDFGDTLYVVEPKELNWSQISFFTTLGWIIISVVSILR